MEGGQIFAEQLGDSYPLVDMIGPRGEVKETGHGLQKKQFISP